MGAARSRGALLLIALVAFLHAGFFIFHMQPDREVFFAAPPQSAGGYEWIARNLLRGVYSQEQATTGPVTPDTQRTPGYPLFLAIVYVFFGVNDTPVLWIQACLFVLICLGLYHLGRRMSGRSLGLLAGLATALYAPIPKYGGMPWSEMLTTFLQVFGIVTLVVAVQRASARWFALAGATLGFLGLTRPTFVYEPLLLAAVLAVLQWRSVQRAQLVKYVAVFLIGWLVVISPWAAFNYIRFGKPTPTVVRTIGKQIWYGYWVGKFPTMTLIQLDDVVWRLKKGEYKREQVPDVIRPLGGDQALMLQYIDEYTSKGHFSGTPSTPEEKVRENMLKDQFYLDRALDHIRHDPLTYLRTQLFFVSFKFWAGEIPVRLTLIGKLPRAVIYASFLAQVTLLLLAIAGCWRLRATPILLALVLVPLLYLYLVHLPFHVEPRYSIPVKPFLLLLAAGGLLEMRDRFFLVRRSPAVFPQTGITAGDSLSVKSGPQS